MPDVEQLRADVEQARVELGLLTEEEQRLVAERKLLQNRLVEIDARRNELSGGWSTRYGMIRTAQNKLALAEQMLEDSGLRTVVWSGVDEFEPQGRADWVVRRVTPKRIFVGPPGGHCAQFRRDGTSITTIYQKWVIDIVKTGIPES